MAPLVSDNAPPPAVETANTLASDRQTILFSLRGRILGDAPTAIKPAARKVLPTVPTPESTAADERTGEIRWELASKLDLGPGSAAAAANAAAVAATNAAVILETANTTVTLASDRQTMLISIRGDAAAPFCYLRPGVCCRRESTAADERTGGVRWELAAGG